MTIGDGGQGCFEIREGFDAIYLAGLCRTRNYAERAGFPQLSF
jgi:hypothetical protein